MMGSLGLMIFLVYINFVIRGKKRIFNLPPNPSGPSGIGSGAIDSEQSRSFCLSVSGGLFLTGLSSSNTSSMGGCNEFCR